MDLRQRALLADADVVVNPMRTDASPNSGIEAMAAGPPSVSARLGKMPYLPRGGKTASRVNPDDVETVDDILHWAWEKFRDAETEVAIDSVVQKIKETGFAHA